MKYAQFELIAKYFPIRIQIYGSSLPIFREISKIIFISFKYVEIYNKTYEQILKDQLLKIENSLDKQIQDY
jgi:hypothetical protein